MKTAGWTGLALLLVTGACLPVSLSPLYTEEQLVTVPGLVGTWGSDDDGKEQMVVTREAGRSYRAIFFEGEDQPTSFEVHLVRIDETLYWDMTPDPEEVDDNGYEPYLVPAHALFRVSLEGDTLMLDALDMDWLKAQADEGRAPAHLVLDDDDRFVLTAPTTELQEFFEHYGGDPEAWTSSDALRRQGHAD
jgi:hypothetical protein